MINDIFSINFINYEIINPIINCTIHIRTNYILRQISSKYLVPLTTLIILSTLLNLIHTKYILIY